MKSYLEAMGAFDNMQIHERLCAVYEQIPSGHCSGCTACCSEAVNTFYSEYLHMARSLHQSGVFKTYAIAAVKYYLTELVEPQKCPMLMTDGLCAVYHARPLPCRVFGHLSESDYLENQDSVLESNREASEAFYERYGLRLPTSVTNRRLGYCQQFRSDLNMTAEDRDDLVDLLFSLESRFLVAGQLEEEDLNYSLVQWFAYDILGKEEATALRVAVTQEILTCGHSQTLLQTLDNIAQKL